MRQYHIIPIKGAPSLGPLSPAQVLEHFNKSIDASTMLVWWKGLADWVPISSCLASIRQEASAPAAGNPDVVPAGQVRVIRDGFRIGQYPEADIAALMRAKVVMTTDHYLAPGMVAPSPISDLLLKMVLTPDNAASASAAPARPAVVPPPVLVPPARRQPGRGEIVCPNPNCGYVGPGKKIARGSTIVGILLLLCWILPGLIYFMFFSGYRICCPRCQCQISNDN